MASQRFRIPVESVAGGVPSASTVTYAQTAGATADFMDLFLDNVDIRSMAHLEMLLEHLTKAVRDRYRQSVGGV